MQLSTTLNSLRPGGNFLRQFFEPVQDDIDLRRDRPGLLSRLEHQEAPAIGRHVVSDVPSRRWQVVPSGSKVGLTTNIGIKEDRELISDAKGLFSTELPPGFYDVLISATAFSPDCRKIRIINGSAADFNPRLKVSTLVTKELGDTFSSPTK
jgi:hypothetical protein